MIDAPVVVVSNLSIFRIWVTDGGLVVCLKPLFTLLNKKQVAALRKQLDISSKEVSLISLSLSLSLQVDEGF